MSETSTEPSSKTDPQQDLLLDHSYDGIQEYDNPMPRWWVLLFWGTFLFAGGYFFHYQLSPNGRGVYDEYEGQMKVAAEQAEKRALAEQVTEESLQELLGKEAMVLAGQAVFQQRCVTCHLDKGQGKIGPNLTDEYALHGGALMDIYGVVHDGVVEKGMQAWGKTLKPIELRQVVAFVGSLRGTNVPGKAPEGEKFDLRSLGSLPTKETGEAVPAEASADVGPQKVGTEAGDAGGPAAPVDSGEPPRDKGTAEVD